MSRIHLSRIVIGDDGKPLARPPARAQAKRDRREEALNRLGTAWLRLSPAEEYPSSRKEHEVRAAKRRAITLAAYGVGDGDQYKNAPREYGGASRAEHYAPPVSDETAMVAMFDDETTDHLGPAELAQLHEEAENAGLSFASDPNPLVPWRPFQPSPVSRRPLTPGAHVNRFGCVQHADGYVFGTQVEYVKRIRDGVEKRIFMVVA